MARGNLVSLPFQIVMHQEHVRPLYSHQLQIESHSNHLVSVTKRKVKHEIIIDKLSVVHPAIQRTILGVLKILYNIKLPYGTERREVEAKQKILTVCFVLDKIRL